MHVTFGFVLLTGADDPSLQEMSENCGGQLIVKARFNFKQNNEDELSFTKGEVILVTRQEEGGWWEGTLNGRTGWFPSNYVREVKTCGELDLSVWVVPFILPESVRGGGFKRSLHLF